MVVISLYKGNLHKVPDVPRRWLMPAPRISLRDFRLLLQKRNRALARLRCDSTKQEEQRQGAEDTDHNNNGCSKQHQSDNNNSNPHDPSTSNTHQISFPHHDNARGEEANEKEVCEKKIDNKDACMDVPREVELKELNGQLQKLGVHPPENPSVLETRQHDREAGSLPQENPVVLVQPTEEVSKDLDALSDKEKRKRELEKKLHVLNEEKHHLVQMLKQIQNAEEELKKCNQIQTQKSGAQVAVPLHLETTATIDMGSVNRQAAFKMSSELNYGGDLGGELEDASNVNTYARHLQRMRSTSPSAASPLRRPLHGSIQHNVVPHLSRANSAGHAAQPTTNLFPGVMASPSRFAPSPSRVQGHHLPPLSIPAVPQQPAVSSPSPMAASSGTSVFRDTRLTSPSWNQR